MTSPVSTAPRGGLPAAQSSAVHHGAWSAVFAMRLVPSRDVPKALAIFNGGNALATVVAAPLGSYLGGIIGWRGAFLCLAPLAMVALAWQWISLPSLKVTSAAAPQRSVLGL